MAGRKACASALRDTRHGSLTLGVSSHFYLIAETTYTARRKLTQDLVGCALATLQPWSWTLISITRSFAGQLTSSRITFLPWVDIYLFQDRDTVKEIWKKSSLLSTVYLRIFAFKYLFGMPSRWLRLYQPNYEEIQEEAHSHLPHDLHVGLLKAMSGSGSVPLFKRFQTALKRNLQPACQHVDWVQKNDFRQLVHQTVGLALIEAVFGPSFIQINPTIMEDIFAFNDSIPWLSKGLPQFIRPGPYKMRRRLLDGFKHWYKYSREHFHESMIAEDGDGDPFWGCAWIRTRQKLMDPLEDDDLIATLDLGLAWG